MGEEIWSIEGSEKGYRVLVLVVLEKFRLDSLESYCKKVVRNIG